jgi:hypothetical protein
MGFFTFHLPLITYNFSLKKKPLGLKKSQEAIPKTDLKHIVLMRFLVSKSSVFGLKKEKVGRLEM